VTRYVRREALNREKSAYINNTCYKRQQRSEFEIMDQRSAFAAVSKHRDTNVKKPVNKVFGIN
jgi:hypothetical protein